jgi:hypothetical protein
MVGVAGEQPAYAPIEHLRDNLRFPLYRVVIQVAVRSRIVHLRTWEKRLQGARLRV